MFDQYDSEAFWFHSPKEETISFFESFTSSVSWPYFIWRVILKPLLIVALLFNVTSCTLKVASFINPFDADNIKVLAFIGVLLLIINIYLIISLFRKVAAQFDDTINVDQYLLFAAIVLCTLLMVIVFWLAIGFLPSMFSSTGKSADLNPGIIGDQFGMVNSLFSGIALSGVVLAIIVQTIDLRYQQFQYRKSLAAQGKQLRIAQKELANSYHLQAMEVYLKVCISDKLGGDFEGLGDPEMERRKYFTDDILETIRLLRESGDVNELTMRIVRRRVALKLAKLKEETGSLESLSPMTEEIDELRKRIQEVDFAVPGSTIIKPLLATFESCSRSGDWVVFDEQLGKTIRENRSI